MLDQLIVCLVVEGQQQHTLLLQVGLVDPRDDKIEFCLKHSWATNAYFNRRGAHLANDLTMIAEMWSVVHLLRSVCLPVG